MRICSATNRRTLITKIIMIKAGDTVRYLNEVGGGVVARVDGKLAYVSDEGFERPVPVNELVVVLPAGHTNTSGAKLMFDQQAFDVGRGSKRNKQEAEKSIPMQSVPATPPQPEEEEFPIEETEYGDAMNVILAFEPKDARRLDSTTFNTALVNDSNYFLSYQLLTVARPGEWTTVARGEVAPNEIADLRTLSHDDIPAMERIVFQAIAYKKDKDFTVKEPLNVLRKLDLTKFFKFHCFRPGLYFDTPVLEIPLLAEPLHKRKSKAPSDKKSK